MGLEEPQQRAVPIGERSAAALEKDDARALRRRGQPHPQAVVDAERTPNLDVEVESSELPSRKEVGQLEDAALTRAERIPQRILLAEPVRGIGDRRRVPLVEHLDAIEDDAAESKIDLLVPHERVRRDQSSETLEDDRWEELAAGRERSLVNDIEERSGIPLAHN